MATLETNVNIFAESALAKNVASLLGDMPFNHFVCDCFTDLIAVPCFVTILDGNLITNFSKDIDEWECYLNMWNAGMRKCPSCKKYHDCLEKAELEKTLDTGGPDYKEPIILLNHNKMQRDIEGLVALIPPISGSKSPSEGFDEWIKSTCLHWQKEALLWREASEEWKSQHKQYIV